ncbi:HEL108Cp [Eremothecium sinecaudum]|uniref:HEL108Cp n=1 Tax=Eremothecium sinecaudum TaxID=45286 RepID=A0A0X8HTE0_9SACH|nr:HEL108Cp [Eremothecium sinecaudum]AMD21172.1 HEL108Cp [Eremothecium sinecaudum]
MENKIDYLRTIAAQNDISGKKLKSRAWKRPVRRHKPTRQLLTDEWKRLTNEPGTKGPAESPKDNRTRLTYFNVQAPPSQYPTKHYCDITGLKARYKSPTNGLRFVNSEVYSLVIKPMTPGVDQEYLKLRGDNVVLK